MLATPGDLLFMSVLVDDFQNTQFHLLSRDGCEAVWSVFSQVLSLFEDGDNIAQLIN